MEVVWAVFLLTFCTCAIIIAAGIPLMISIAIVFMVMWKFMDWLAGRLRILGR